MRIQKWSENPEWIFADHPTSGFWFRILDFGQQLWILARGSSEFWILVSYRLLSEIPVDSRSGFWILAALSSSPDFGQALWRLVSAAPDFGSGFWIFVFEALRRQRRRPSTSFGHLLCGNSPPPLASRFCILILLILLDFGVVS